MSIGTRAIRRLPLVARHAAQGTVEWVIGTAVLAFVGIAAWTAVGGAITAAFNRLVATLAQSGV
jgi:hypothetical protein